jgi:predicted component of type VI protein secretion system
LEGNFVSGWHGIIRFDESGTYYFDLGSTNGTCLDGSRLPKNTPISITQSTRLTVWMFELTIIPGPISEAGKKPPPRPFTVNTMVGTGRTTDVLSTPAVTQAPLSRSQVSFTPPVAAPAAPPVAAPATGSVAPISTSRIVSAGAAGARATLPTPPAAEPRQPSRIVPPRQAAEQSSDRLVRCLRIIGAFTDAFMGLKKGYEQFGSEVGVRPLRGTTRLHRARTSQEIIEYLLDPATDPEACARDLNAVFADMGIHDLALIEGISQSVRSLLAKLAPDTVDLKASSGLWSGGKAKAKWTSYVDSFNNLLGEDAALHAEIFGEEFASGYASVAQGDGDSDDDVE